MCIYFHIESIIDMHGFKAVSHKLNLNELANVRPPSQRLEKLVHFLRHAQGHHNVAGEADYNQYKSEEFEDAQLSDEGVAQCKELNEIAGDFIRESLAGGRVELVVTSVLQRCLQTSTLCFPELRGKVPWIATELCREQTGQHPCDRRRPLSETIADPAFSHISFEEITSEKDPLYWKWNNGEREPAEACIERCEQFLHWLYEREEVEIIVCTHSAILSHLVPLIERESDGEAFQRYRNAEMRSYVITKN